MSSTLSRTQVVWAVGFGQMLAWGSSYYLLAVLAGPMARGLDIPPLWVYLMFSAALLVSAALGPYAGGRVDRKGGRQVLMFSNGLFAVSHLTLASAQGPWTLALGWLLLGAAMPFGLYDAAFATLVRLYRQDARKSIVGVTLIAGFASSVAWPISALLEHHGGWRVACVMWAALHLTMGLGIHTFFLPKGVPPPAPPPVSTDEGLLEAALEKPAAPPTAAASPLTFWILAGTFTCSGFVFAAFAAHLPRVLETIGCTPAHAVAAASLVGVAQVGGRLLEAGYLHRLHPLYSVRFAMSLHPVATLLLALIGAPFAVLFTILHGIGVGLITILKGTLPLALFGAQGFGRRAGLLEAPSKVAQALAPVVFGLALEQWGGGALALSGGIAFIGLCGVLYLHRSAAQHGT